MPQSLSLLKIPNLDPNELKSRCPVSNLHFLRLRRKSSFTSCYNTSRCLGPFQSAFCQHHSTETAVVRAPNDLLSACDHGHISVLWLIYRLLLKLWTITFSSRRFIPSLASHHSPCLVPLLSVHTRSVSVHCSYQTCCCAVWSASGFSPWACPVYCLYPATRSCGSPFGMAVPHACRRYSTSMDQLASLHRLFASTWNLILSNIQCWQSTAQQRKKKLEPSR